MGRTNPVDDDGEPDLPFQQSGSDGRPVEQIGCSDVASLRPRVGLEAVDEEAAFHWREEAGGFGTVGQQPKAGQADQDGGDAFEHEDPAPACEAGNAVHLLDCESQKPGECAG